jgi:hypothetical protein
VAFHRTLAVTRVALAFLLAGLLAGCGSSSNDASSAGGSTSGESPSAEGATSKEAFLAEGNAICEARGKAIQAKGSKILSSGTGARQAAAAQTVIVRTLLVPGFQAELRELGELTPPTGQSHDMAFVLTAIRQMVNRLEHEPPITSSSSFKANHPYRPAEEIAAEFGLNSCGHP